MAGLGVRGSSEEGRMLLVDTKRDTGKEEGKNPGVSMGGKEPART